MQTMNKTESTQIEICLYCGFTENPPGAHYCLQCYRSLKDGGSSTKTSWVSWSSFPIVLLLLFSGGFGLLWRKNSISLQKVTKNAMTELPTNVQKENQSYSSGLQLKESFNEVRNVPQGVFFYGGAMATAGISSQNILTQIAKSQPQFQLNYEDPLVVAPNSGTAIQMLIDGKISFAQSFRPLKQSEYDLAQSRGFKLKQIPIATSTIAFYVNPKLNIPGLSIDQLEQIYSGQVTNWRQLGGPDLPIVAITHDPNAKAINSFLFQSITNKQQYFGRNFQVVRDTTSAIRKVAETPGAIGYGAQPLIANQTTIQPIGLARRGSQNFVHPVEYSGNINKQGILNGSYPLIRRIFVILREDGEIDELAGRAYVNLLLSKEGQTLIDRAGYLPIRFQPKH